MMPSFTIGERVRKVGGRYGGPGRVIGITEDMGGGYHLYNVAMKVADGYGEFVHVFPDSVLERMPIDIEEGDPTPACEDCGYSFAPREQQRFARLVQQINVATSRAEHAERQLRALQDAERKRRSWIRRALKAEGKDCKWTFQDAWAALVAERNRLHEEIARRDGRVEA